MALVNHGRVMDNHSVNLSYRFMELNDEAQAAAVEGLMAAIERDDEAALRQWLESKGDPNERGVAGCSLAAVAARSGALGCLRSLIEAGADLDDGDDALRETPALWAARGGHADCLRALRDAGANLALPTVPYDDQDPSPMFTPALEAASRGHWECLAVFDDASLTARNAAGVTAAVMAVVGMDDERGVACLAALERSGVDWDEPLRSGRTPLMAAAENGQLGCLLFLAQRGARLNQVAHGDGKSAAMLAARHGRMESLALLDELGADLGLAGPGGDTARQEAFKGRHFDCVAFIDARLDRLALSQEVQATSSRPKAPRM